MLRVARLTLAGVALCGAVMLGGPSTAARSSNLTCRRMSSVERCDGQLDHRTLEHLLATVRMLGDGNTLRAHLLIDTALSLDPSVTATFTPELQTLALDSHDRTNRLTIHAPMNGGPDAPLLDGCFRIVFGAMHVRGGDSTARSWSWDLFPSNAC